MTDPRTTFVPFLLSALLSALLPAALLVLAATGCKSTGPQPDALSTQQAVQRATEAARRADELPLPADPLFVARLQPDRLDVAAARLAGDSPQEDEKSEDAPSLTREDSPPTHLASTLVAHLLAGRIFPSQLQPPPQDGFQLEHLNRTAAMYVAPHAAPYRQELKRIRTNMGLPTLRELPDSIRVRLLLPSHDPEGLAEELEAHCQTDSPEPAEQSEDSKTSWPAGRCPSLVRTKPAERWLRVDLDIRLGEDAAASGPSDGQTDSPAPGASEAERPYFDRVTPSAVAFFAPGSAVTIHSRASNWWKLSVLSTVINDPPRRLRREASPRRRRRMLRQFSRRLHRLSQLVVGSATEAREFEDATLRMTVTPNGQTPSDSTGLTAELVRTFTKRGREVADANTATPRLPNTRIDAPLVEFSWSGDARAAAAASGEVGWIEQLSDIDEPWDRNRAYRPIDEWAPFAGLLFYPTAFLDGFSELRFSRYPSPQNALRRLEDLRGIRLDFDIDRDRSDGLKINPRVAAVLRVRPDSNLDASLDTLLRFAEHEMGLPTSLEVVDGPPDSDDLVYRVTLGLDQQARASAFGEPETLPGGWRLQLHPKPLGREFGDAGILQRIPTHRYHDETLLLDNTSGPRAARTRLWLGAGTPPDRLPLAPQAEIQGAPAAPTCMQEAVAATRRLQESIGRGSEATLPQLQGLVERLESLAKTCGAQRATHPQEDVRQAKQTVRWMAGIYRHKTGQKRAEDFLWNSAADHYQRACDSGVEAACADLQTARRRADRHQLPRIAGEPYRFQRSAMPILQVETDSLRVGDRGITLSSGISDDDLAGLLKDRDLIDWDAPYNFGDRYLLALAPARDVPAGWLREIVEAVRRLHESEDNGQPPNGALWLSILPEQQQLAYHYTEFWSGDPKARTLDGKTPLEVELSDDGINLTYQDEKLPPSEGCPDDGPTVCDGFDALQKRLIAFKKKHPKRTHSALRVDPDVDYGRFAGTLQALTRADEDAEAPDLYRAPNLPYGGLFPKVHLRTGQDP